MNEWIVGALICLWVVFGVSAVVWVRLIGSSAMQVTTTDRAVDVRDKDGVIFTIQYLSEDGKWVSWIRSKSLEISKDKAKELLAWSEKNFPEFTFRICEFRRY